MSYLEECLEQFNKLPVAFKNKIGSLEAFEKIEAMEEEFGIDLKFLVILVAIREVALKDIPEYLQTKYQLVEEDAFEIRDWLISDIFQLTSNDSVEKISDEVKPEENIFLNSKEEVVKIFHVGLVDILKEPAETKTELIKNLNEAIFSWLAQDGLFQNELLKALLGNQESITAQRLKFEDREVPPTINQWLKNFINKVGADNCSELIIAQYLSDSPEVKKLSIPEKNIIRKLIRIYYNLSFFPESLQGVALENWEIIPTNKIKNDEIKKELKIPSPAISKKVVSSEVNNSEISSAVSSLKTAEQISPDASLLQELELAIKNYSEDTLEYKVLNQEIKRLKRKK